MITVLEPSDAVDSQYGKEFFKYTREQRVAVFNSAMQQTVEGVILMSKIIAASDHIGDTHELEIPASNLRFLRLIGRGRKGKVLIPESYVQCSMNRPVMNRLLSTNISFQKKLMRSPEVELEFRSEGSFDRIKRNISTLNTKEAIQVFLPDGKGLRDRDQQQKFITSTEGQRQDQVRKMPPANFKPTDDPNVFLVTGGTLTRREFERWGRTINASQNSMKSRVPR